MGKCNVSANIKNNTLNLKYSGRITKGDIDSLYTDVRFTAGDLKPQFQVISDLTECKLIYLNGLPTFRKINNYIISMKSGEIVQVLQNDRVISKQIVNFTLKNRGYKPMFASSAEDAQKRLDEAVERKGVRFLLHDLSTEIIYNESKTEGTIRDISISGCAVMTDNLSPEVDDPITVEFMINGPDQENISFQLQARIVRVNDEGFACSFTDLDDGKSDLLWNCLLHESR